MKDRSVSEEWQNAALANPGLIEENYERFLSNPEECEVSWKELFSSLDTAKSSQSVETPKGAGEANESVTIQRLLEAYRTHGHLKAKTNPLVKAKEEKKNWQLELERFNLNESDLKKEFPTLGILPERKATLSQIIQHLEEIYCGSVGVEYMGLGRLDMEAWLQERVEKAGFHGNLTIEQKKMILQHLNKSELLEIFIHTKYTGQKRFSLEGGETLIPMLAATIEQGAEGGTEEFIIGMAHRGRLNVLSNILNKSYSLIFSEFDEKYIPESFEQSGDVKYHKGFFSEATSLHGHKVLISLTPNPSHLEAVDPVIEGQVYAKQLLAGEEGKKKVMPILIHGDAALAGQGVVYETMQLQSLEGYGTGGTVHLVINNQIGFTTIPKDSRSTEYCTDIAHTFGAPIFHVNAEDPEGCVFATCLAVEMRQKFQCDVFVDLVCYRKYGHNENDEPSFTQPLEYAEIANKKSVREIYRDALIQQGVLEKKMCEEVEAEFRAALQEELEFIKNSPKRLPSQQAIQGKAEVSANFTHIQTGIPFSQLREIAEVICTIPKDFTPHPKLKRLQAERMSMISEDPSAKPIDWGMAEMLALGSLLWDGIGVRLSGQDSCRGTFSHRHAVWIDQKMEEPFCALKNLKSVQGNFEIFNSSLSEYAVLGFEFGYTIANPNVLVLWEAQFGDFCNGAQVIIDQFISTGEQKWGQQSGLTLLLPHGYEGQGPEHSSARIERFLTLAGQNNMKIVNASTPAQLFHLLRRQQLSNEKKPLILFTPKGLLRHPACISRISDLEKGSFQEIIDDPQTFETVQELIVCSGHVYYDLIAERDKVQAENVAIIRIEQFYPFHRERMLELFDKYNGFKQLTWVQEEPKNMGAALFINEILQGILPQDVMYRSIGRPRSASPAVGSYAMHKKQLSDLLSAVFNKAQPSIFEIASQTKAKS